MQGQLSIVLHAHLPFVRHPEHERFLEEAWLFEAITESYLPLILEMDGWLRDGMRTRLTMTLSPTLCAMLTDPLLQDRYNRHLDGLIALAEKEIHRTHWDRPYRELAWHYHFKLSQLREIYYSYGRNVVGAFRKFQEKGILEIITCAATHGLLPLLEHPPSVRAQILTARDHYESCFGCEPKGIWLPECAYVEGVEKFLQEANIRWFIMDTHGLLHAKPAPRYGVFAPAFTRNGIAAFARDLESARQVWSRDQGYPGDPRYRDFYRDIGHDLDFDYVKPHLPSPDTRGMTGIKYHRITGPVRDKLVYDPDAAREAAAQHAGHFLQSRIDQVRHLAGVMDRPPLIVSPYDAELFGHWWYEGPQFLDFFMRKLHFDQDVIELVTPSDYLRKQPTNQLVTPSTSSWGEEGYFKLWLNEKNEWIYPHLSVAQERMTALAEAFPDPNPLQLRALNQAARELLLAQASDWPFIMRTGTSPEYAKRRVKDHLLRFIALHEMLTTTRIDEKWLADVEWRDNLFPAIDYRNWAGCGETG
jgi:1,4-alpha-glucan branching enzyme